MKISFETMHLMESIHLVHHKHDNPLECCRARTTATHRAAVAGDVRYQLYNSPVFKTKVSVCVTY